MRKLIVTEFISADNVIENPMWSMPYWNDQISDIKQAELFDVDALLLGRVTYEGFAEAWPSRTDEDGYADRINSMPKYVASTTLTEPAWQNTTVIEHDLPAAVRELKQQSGQDILIFGSGKLVQSLMPHDLIDEYRLLVYPVILGTGQKLFEAGNDLKFKLIETRPCGSGVILVRYEPDRE